MILRWNEDTQCRDTHSQTSWHFRNSDQIPLRQIALQSLNFQHQKLAFFEPTPTYSLADERPLRTPLGPSYKRSSKEDLRVAPPGYFYIWGYAYITLGG